MLHRKVEAVAESRAIATEEALRGQTRGQHFDGRGDAVVEQRITHGRAGRNQRGHVPALRQREAPRERAADPPRQDGHVVMEVVLEEGVVRRHHGQSMFAREARRRVVRDEGRVDVHEIDARGELGIQHAAQRATVETPVFRIQRHAARGHAQDGRVVVVRRAGIRRRDQRGLDAERGEVGPEGADRSGDAVDAWEIHVGNEQDSHEAPGDQIR